MKIKYFKTLSMIIVLLTVLAVSTSAMAFGRGGHGGFGKGAFFNRFRTEIMDQLDLTKEQKEAIKEHQYQIDLKRTELYNQMKVLQIKVKYELDKEQLNPAVIDEIVQQLKDVNSELIQLRVDSVVEIRQILTYEQFEKLQQLIHEKMSKSRKQSRCRRRCKVPEPA